MSRNSKNYAVARQAIPSDFDDPEYVQVGNITSNVGGMDETLVRQFRKPAEYSTPQDVYASPSDTLRFGSEKYRPNGERLPLL